MALKIVKAAASKDNKELEILLHLSDPGLEHLGKRHVVKLLDHFEHHGPNGTHLCLVFPVLISDGKEMIRAGIPRQITMVQAIAKQILLGVDFLHSQSIIHCGKGMAPKIIAWLRTLMAPSGRSETRKHHVCP